MTNLEVILLMVVFYETIILGLMFRALRRYRTAYYDTAAMMLDLEYLARKTVADGPR